MSLKSGCSSGAFDLEANVLFSKSQKGLFSMFENYVVLVVLNIPNTVEFVFH